MKVELLQSGGLHGSKTVIVKFYEYCGKSVSFNLTSSLTKWLPTRDFIFVETYSLKI